MVALEVKVKGINRFQQKANSRPIKKSARVMQDSIKIENNYFSKLAFIQIKNLSKLTIKIKLKKTSINVYAKAFPFIKIIILNKNDLISTNILVSS